MRPSMWRIALVLSIAMSLTARGAASNGAAKPTTKGMAWMLGSNLSHAALMHERGATEQSDSMFGKAKILADELKVEVPTAPRQDGRKFERRSRRPPLYVE